MAKRPKPKVRKTETGWPKRKPRSGLQRRELKESCGAQAFLDPKKLAYPVMTPPTGRARACTLDCAGAQAAYKRARQQHSIAKKAGFPTDAAYHNRMAKKAHALGKKFGCKWAARAFGPTK